MDKNGGPAFPWVVPTTGADIHEMGMSLRDYFAAAALNGLVGTWTPTPDMRQSNGGLGTDDFIVLSAKQCYRLADAMLKERDK